MSQLRIFAALLSILSLLVAAWMHLGGAPVAVVAAIAVGAACLAVVAPFDAPDPPQRRRVLWACIAHVAAIAVAAVLAVAAEATLPRLGSLMLLLLLGGALSARAFATRNRRRIKGWGGYFTN
ncbi:hypothetical protein [Sphingomonas lenta]|uniref:Uncharacterized protein n=1 Tax=Sphingomonas lenta TaxID=1141887 RepID=A0A2A2SDN0_9SPHN|nr:hypothetical protein [Sphingomonas lenta]PAX07323.1 hypothetical protein CKY28_15010 [Sphingomonas lenta]